MPAPQSRSTGRRSIVEPARVTRPAERGGESGHGLMLWLLAAWLICFGGGCATTAPTDRPSAPTTTLDETGSDRAGPLATDADSAAVSPLGHPLANPRSLSLALSVLEGEGARNLDAEQRERVARALVFAEAEHGFPVLLSLAIIRQESRFDPAAKGPAGSIGLMQLQPATAHEVARRAGLNWNHSRTLLDPEQNVRLGLAYLEQLRLKFGSTEYAVAAYNIGPGKLRRLLARRPLRRGPYLTKVYAHVDALRKEYGE